MGHLGCLYIKGKRVEDTTRTIKPEGYRSGNTQKYRSSLVNGVNTRTLVTLKTGERGDR